MLFEYEGYPNEDIFQRHIVDFNPFICKHTNYKSGLNLEKLLENQSEVEVSCAPLRYSFSGDEVKLQTIKIKLNTFIQAYLDVKEHQKSSSSSSSSSLSHFTSYYHH